MSPEETEKYIIKAIDSSFLKVLIPGRSWAIIIFCGELQIRHICRKGGYPKCIMSHTIHPCKHTPPDWMLKTYYLLGGERNII
jgi:hypothetical protein